MVVLGLRLGGIHLVPATEVLAAASPAARALAFFEQREDDGAGPLFHRLRPAPSSPILRAAILAALPAQGELRPTQVERAKMAGLEQVFRLHQRDGLVVVKLIDVGHAFVGLHARTVLLVSRDALSLLGAEEVQALAAHELGHELFWDDYERARRDASADRMRELELRCDGVAVATLGRLGLGPEPLVDAVTRMTRYNEALGATATAGRYVPLEQRRRFIRDVARLLARTIRPRPMSPIPPRWP